MPYYVDRIDFVGNTPECHFQDGGRVHSVRKGIAFILKDDTGREYIAGPKCAQAHTQDTNWGKAVPDFTKGVIRVALDNHPGRGGAGGGTPNEQEDDPNAENDFAIAYLRLRMEKLVDMGFKDAAYAGFTPYYDKLLRAETLDVKERKHIENTNKKQRETNGKFHMDRLQQCYATAFLLDSALRTDLRAENRSYLQSFRDQIIRNYTLTNNQIDTARAIIARIDDPLFRRFELRYFA